MQRKIMMKRKIEIDSNHQQNKRIEMNFDEILKEPFYNFGWFYEKTITFFGKENNIKVDFEAYPETEQINQTQKDSFLRFYENIADLSKAAENQLNDYITKYVEGIYTIDKDVQLTEVLINSDGELILLCEVAWDIENGLGIKIFPEIEIGPQDTFL